MYNQIGFCHVNFHIENQNNDLKNILSNNEMHYASDIFCQKKEINILYSGQ